MAWQSELVLMLRHCLNDLEVEGTDPTYTSDRLEESLLIGAHYVNQEVNLAVSYTVDVDECTLSPDPTTSSPRDSAFINLVILKTLCIIDKSEFRTSALRSGVKIKDGTSEIDTKTSAGGGGMFDLMKNSCQMYEDAKWEYQVGNFRAVKAILSPFTGEDSPAHTSAQRGFGPIGRFQERDTFN